MFQGLLIIVHVVVSIALIMIVLLQTGKGADMGAAFGGGSSQTLFGATGASTFLSKATTAAAIIFMLTSLFLAYAAGKRENPLQLELPKPAVEQNVTTESAPAATDANVPTEEVTEAATESDSTEAANSTTEQPSASTDDPETAPSTTEGDTATPTQP